MGRMLWAAMAVVMTTLLGGCVSYYTRHMSETWKDAKVEGKTFVILPVMDIEYNPPKGCFGSGSKDGSVYEKPWLDAVVKSLRSSFKKQTFQMLTREDVAGMGFDVPALYSAASDDILSMGVAKTESGPGGPPKVVYEPARGPGKAGQLLNGLGDSAKADYVILLVQPKMTGQVHYTHTAQGVSAHTVYTSDVHFGVWSAETGELAYASGAINGSSGFCFFISAQQASINGTSSDIAQQLKVLIARLLREEKLPVELTRAGS